MYKFCGILIVLFCIAAKAQLAVTVSSPKVIGQKAVVPMKLENHLSENIKSGRAVCFLLDNNGRMVGQSTKWIIAAAGLARGATNDFSFVITSPAPFATTNLTAKVNFTQLIFENGNRANIKQDVQIK